MSTSLKKLVLPATIKSIDGLMCFVLNDLELKEGLESVSNFNTGMMEKLVFPSTLKSIESMYTMIDMMGTNTELYFKILDFGGNDYLCSWLWRFLAKPK